VDNSRIPLDPSITRLSRRSLESLKPDSVFTGAFSIVVVIYPLIP